MPAKWSLRPFQDVVDPYLFPTKIVVVPVCAKPGLGALRAGWRYIAPHALSAGTGFAKTGDTPRITRSEAEGKPRGGGASPYPEERNVLKQSSCRTIFSLNPDSLQDCINRFFQIYSNGSNIIVIHNAIIIHATNYAVISFQQLDEISIIIIIRH